MNKMLVVNYGMFTRFMIQREYPLTQNIMVVLKVQICQSKTIVKSDSMKIVFINVIKNLKTTLNTYQLQEIE